MDSDTSNNEDGNIPEALRFPRLPKVNKLEPLDWESAQELLSDRVSELIRNGSEQPVENDHSSTGVQHRRRILKHPGTAEAVGRISRSVLRLGPILQTVFQSSHADSTDFDNDNAPAGTECNKQTSFILQTSLTNEIRRDKHNRQPVVETSVLFNQLIHDIEVRRRIPQTLDNDMSAPRVDCDLFTAAATASAFALYSENYSDLRHLSTALTIAQSLITWMDRIPSGSKKIKIEYLIATNIFLLDAAILCNTALKRLHTYEYRS